MANVHPGRLGGLKVVVLQKNKNFEMIAELFNFNLDET